MLQARSGFRLAVLAVLVPALSACGGDASGGAAGPAPAPTVETPAGVSATRVNAARDRVVEVCKARAGEGDKPSEAESVADLRAAAADLEESFRANPDEKFRRRPGAPASSMRDRVRAAALVLLTRCGGAGARKVGRNLSRAASATPATPSPTPEGPAG